MIEDTVYGWTKDTERTNTKRSFGRLSQIFGRGNGEEGARLLQEIVVEGGSGDNVRPVASP